MSRGRGKNLRFFLVGTSLRLWAVVFSLRWSTIRGLFGAVIAAQFWDSLRESVERVDELIAGGEFAPILAWLRDNVHSLGAKLEVPALVEHATGKPLSVAPYLRYLERKYLSDW